MRSEARLEGTARRCIQQVRLIDDTASERGVVGRRAGRARERQDDQPTQQKRRPAPARQRTAKADRKSVAEGKSVSVRVDPGGRRLIKKKHDKQPTNKTHVQNE